MENIIQNNEQIETQEEARIKRIMLLCDNLMYSDYCNTGGELKTQEEIILKIKKEVKESLIGFYGEQYADQISPKIDEVQIGFSYNLYGEHNSIKRFLAEKQNEYFISKGGDPLSFYLLRNIESFFHYYDDADMEFLIENPELILEHPSLDDCLKLFGLDKSIFTTHNIEKMIEFRNLVKENYNRYAQYLGTYSDNPEINEKIQELAKLYREQEKAPRHGEDPIYRGNYERADIDPDVMGSYVEASYCKGTNVLTLGVQPSDWTILHEFIHLIEKGGFQIFERLDEEKAPFSFNMLRKNEIFDEVCVDYFAKLIYEERQRQGKDAIVNSEPIKSAYSTLFPVVGPLIDRLLPVIKEAKMQNGVSGIGYNASQYISQLIGAETFDRLCLFCNELYSVSRLNNLVAARDEIIEKLKLSPEDIILKLKLKERDNEIKKYGEGKTEISLEGEIESKFDLNVFVELLMQNVGGIDTLLEDESFNDEKALQTLIQSVKELPTIVNEITQKPLQLVTTLSSNPYARQASNEPMTM